MMVRLFSWSRAFALLGLMGCLAGYWGPANAEEARLAVATNFRSAMIALEAEFEGQSEHCLTVTYGATGLLFAQIKRGAPFDVLLAADMVRPQVLDNEGAVVPGQRFAYADGHLVLWDPDGGAVGPERLSGPIRRLAIANPDLAPYGAAAVSALARSGQLERLRDRIVQGQNIGQTFSYVATRNAELGFVSLSQVIALPAEEQGRWWTVPGDWHDPIRQEAALLLRGADNEAAEAFFVFLQSAQARAIIRDHGYSLP